MDVTKCRVPRNPNAKVRFSLSEYTSSLFGLFGYTGTFQGPGPVEIRGGCDGGPAPASFPVTYLASEIFSKLDMGGDKLEKALSCRKKFDSAEALCADTNYRFLKREFLYQGTTTPGYTPAQALWRAREKLNKLLEGFSVDAVLEHVGHGPGATTRLKRSEAHLSKKIGGSPHSTKEASTFLPPLWEDCPGWAASFAERPTHEIVYGNKLVTVPKDWKQDRMIAIEPEWNMFFQKGIGGWIRSRLRRVGIELSDQSNNQLLAGLGSLYGTLATIDLSMASDCMSYELVRFLCPPDVFDALASVRARVGSFASGEVVYYQKFSSMGNGATFDLETAIFWSLASAVIDLMGLEDRRLLVYGDDIIVPTACYTEVLDVLRVAGFVPNAKKSFGDGPFRESCGSHFYLGTDVTPIYVREAVNRLDRLFLLHNNTCRLLVRYWDFIQYPEQVAPFLEWIRGHAPSNWRRPRLPDDSSGDGAFIGSFEECTPRRAKKGYNGWRVRTLQFGKIQQRTPPRIRDELGFYPKHERVPRPHDDFDQHLAMWCSLYDLDRSESDWWFTIRNIRSAPLVGKLYRFRELPHGSSDVPERPVPRAYPSPEGWRTVDQLVSGSHPFYAPWHALRHGE